MLKNLQEKMTKTILNFSSSFSEKLGDIRSGLRFFKKHHMFLLKTLRKTCGVIDYCEKSRESIDEIFEHGFSNPDAKWPPEDVAFFVTILCLFESDEVSKWVSEYKPANHGFYTHPELVDEFMSVYGRYFEQYGFKPKPDGGDDDDDEPTPKTPSPDLLNV